MLCRASNLGVNEHGKKGIDIAKDGEEVSDRHEPAFNPQKIPSCVCYDP
jgi:hypothetical protein